MRKNYKFSCSCCKLVLILHEGTVKKTQTKIINYYCYNCNQIFNDESCSICGDKLYYIIQIPEQKNQITSLKDSLEIRIKCPRCESRETNLRIIS